MFQDTLGEFSSVGTPSPQVENPVLSRLLKGQSQALTAGVAEMKVSKDPESVIATYSLGTCIGLAIYDPVAKVGGILHFQLPDSSISYEKRLTKPAMFADTGIPALFRACQKLGAKMDRIVVKAAGGASGNRDKSVFNIGRRNRTALAEVFGRAGKNIHAQDLGGKKHRTMWLDLATGQVTLKVGYDNGRTTWRTL